MILNAENLHSDYVSGERIEEYYFKYRISCKIGTYCSFGLEQISNQRHSHSCFELCVIISGKGLFIYGDTSYAIKEGDIIIADPHVMHEIQSSDPNCLKLLYIFLEIASNDANMAARSQEDTIIGNFLAGHSIMAASQNHLLSYLMFIENYNTPKKKLHYGTHNALKYLVFECMMALSESRPAAEDKKIAQNTIESCLDYIDSNLHKRIRVMDIARHVCTSQRNLEYIFNKHFNTTVIDYVNEKKIRLACHYIEMYFGITDTAYMVGIGNSSQFSKLFKKYTGMTPKEYRLTKVKDKNGMGRRMSGG